MHLASFHILALGCHIGMSKYFMRKGHTTLSSTRYRRYLVWKMQHGISNKLHIITIRDIRYDSCLPLLLVELIHSVPIAILASVKTAEIGSIERKQAMKRVYAQKLSKTELEFQSFQSYHSWYSNRWRVKWGDSIESKGLLSSHFRQASKEIELNSENWALTWYWGIIYVHAK